MKVEETALPGVLVFEPRRFSDDRGFFQELFRADRYPIGPFVQDNLSHSRRGILRGLHYQDPLPQGKLVQALTGEIFDVAVDIRRDSPHFGRWVGVTLSGSRQLWIPPGFAHGFCVLSDSADVFYKCTQPYVAENDRALLWSDPDLAIPWPLDPPILSPRDATAPRLRDGIK